jgi:hypothetical protein
MLFLSSFAAPVPFYECMVAYILPPSILLWIYIIPKRCKTSKFSPNFYGSLWFMCVCCVFIKMKLARCASQVNMFCVKFVLFFHCHCNHALWQFSSSVWNNFCYQVSWSMRKYCPGTAQHGMRKTVRFGPMIPFILLDLTCNITMLKWVYFRTFYKGWMID